GERPEFVHFVGAPGLDNIALLKLLDRPEIEAALDWKLGHPLFLVTYHPATLADQSPAQGATELLAAVADFPESWIIFTTPNADIGGRAISRMIEEFTQRRQDRVRVFTSLGQLKYLSILKLADVVIGNSSSGLIEAPALGKPTVNVGPRQQGRLRGETVID